MSLQNFRLPRASAKLFCRFTTSEFLVRDDSVGNAAARSGNPHWRRVGTQPHPPFHGRFVYSSKDGQQRAAPNGGSTESCYKHAAIALLAHALTIQDFSDIVQRQIFRVDWLAKYATCLYIVRWMRYTVL